MWTGHKLKVSNMRIFGCEAMVHLPYKKRNKLDLKSHKMIFVGYCKNTKRYVFLLLKLRKAFKSRDDIFLESKVKRDYVPIELTRNERSIQKKDGEEILSDDSFNGETESKSQSDSEYISDESIESSPNRNVTVRTRSQILKVQKQEENSYLCFDEQFLNYEIPDNYEQAMKSLEASKWITSIKEELDAYQQKHGHWLIKLLICE